jgi:DNA-binding MarR family transcriptional regulator
MKLAHSAHHEPEQSLYVLLTDQFNLLDDTDRQFFGEYGLSARQFWALHHLGEADGLSMIDLSRLVFTDKSSITAIADRLEGAELIQRSPSPHDRRVTMLRLTAKGRHLHDEVFVAHQERISAIIGGDEAELRQVMHSLERIHRRFEQHLHPDPGATHASHASAASHSGPARSKR